MLSCLITLYLQYSTFHSIDTLKPTMTCNKDKNKFNTYFLNIFSCGFRLNSCSALLTFNTRDTRHSSGILNRQVNWNSSIIHEPFMIMFKRPIRKRKLLVYNWWFGFFVMKKNLIEFLMCLSSHSFEIFFFWPYIWSFNHKIWFAYGNPLGPPGPGWPIGPG